MEFSPSPRWADRARQWVTDTLTHQGLPAVAETAELLVSELATNAIVHASTEVIVEAHRWHDRLRVAVSDADIRLPAMAALDAEVISGRGLRVVNQLADDWGVYMRLDGKTVWFELTT